MNKLTAASVWLLLGPAVLAASPPPLRVAAVFGRTGEAKVHGLPSIRGARLAVKIINRQGGIRGRKLRMTVYDHASSVSVTRKVVKRAINSGAVCIFGPEWSSYALTMATVCRGKDTVMLTPFATNAEVTRIGTQIFRTICTDNERGKLLAAYAVRALSADTAAVLVNANSDYNIGLAQAFSREYRLLKGRILYHRYYLARQHDLEAYAEDVKDAGAKVIFVSGYPYDSVRVVKQLRKKRVRGTVLGNDAWNRQMLTWGRHSLAGAHYSKLWYLGGKRWANRQFVYRYRKEYRIQEPSSAAPFAYDAMMLLARALRSCRKYTTPHIRRALLNVRNFPGATGTISILPGGDADVKNDNAIYRFTKRGRSFLRLFSY